MRMAWPRSCGPTSSGELPAACRQLQAQGGPSMRRILVLAAALAWIVVATEARGDMVYLKDGQSIWGKDAYEEGDSVVVVRPGGDLRFPKAQVSRIERTRSSLPPFYTPPESVPPAPAAGPAGAAGTPGTPGTPGAPAPAGSPGAPPATGGPSAPPAAPEGTSGSGSAGGSSRATTPPATGPTALPPAPPPPPLGGSGSSQ